ncbi:hypothetical protein BGZ58_001702, partial [Dissophora ornata]
PAYKDNIAVYHSIKSPELKKHILDQFRTGEVRLLLATEAVGMGCDINDIARVVQYRPAPEYLVINPASWASGA